MSVFQWSVEYDREATAHAISAIEVSGAETCGCQDCRNWIAVRKTAFPDHLVHIFEELGIRVDRESEIGIPYNTGAGTLMYSGFFHFVGRIIDGPSIMHVIKKIKRHKDIGPGAVSSMKLHPVTDACSIGLHSKRDLLPVSFANIDVVQLEFTVIVPWALSEARA